MWSVQDVTKPPGECSKNHNFETEHVPFSFTKRTERLVILSPESVTEHVHRTPQAGAERLGKLPGLLPTVSQGRRRRGQENPGGAVGAEQLCEALNAQLLGWAAGFTSAAQGLFSSCVHGYAEAHLATLSSGAGATEATALGRTLPPHGEGDSQVLPKFFVQYMSGLSSHYLGRVLYHWVKPLGTGIPDALTVLGSHGLEWSLSTLSHPGGWALGLWPLATVLVAHTEFQRRLCQSWGLYVCSFLPSVSDLVHGLQLLKVTGRENLIAIFPREEHSRVLQQLQVSPQSLPTPRDHLRENMDMVTKASRHGECNQLTLIWPG